jgi:hypothetical protein
MPKTPKHSNDSDLTPQDLRHPKPNVIDQRQQRIDPANHHTDDPTDRPVPNSKQPGTMDGDKGH